MSVPSLNASRFHVWLDQPDHPDADEGVVYRELLVRSGDQLRAELEANKLRLPGLKEAPLHATALWIWAACARLGYTEATAQPFLADELVSYRPVDQGVVPVDPTGLTTSSESG